MRLGPRELLVLAAGCAVAFVVLLLLAYDSHAARSLDASALSGLFSVKDGTPGHLLQRSARLGNAGVVGLLGVAIACLPLARGRPRVALAVVALLVATSVSSQLLKAVLAHPRPSDLPGAGGVDAAAFPSGHATAAMSLALALVIATPTRLRPLAWFVGAGFAIVVPLGVIVDGGHFPSDVLGGYLLACGWTLAVVAGLRWADARWPERTWRGALAAGVETAAERAAAVGLGALAAVGALVLVVGGVALLGGRLPRLLDFAGRHTAAVAAAMVVVACCLTLTALFTVALSAGARGRRSSDVADARRRP